MTNGGGNVFSGSIPGRRRGARIDYYVTATDSGGHTVTFPRTRRRRRSSSRSAC
jgi:hypothetical protein